MPKKDFTQVALDVVRRATGEVPPPSPPTEHQLNSRKGGLRGGRSRMEGMTPEQRAKTGTHNRRGKQTVAEFVEGLVVGHVEDHVAQIKQVLGTPG